MAESILKALICKSVPCNKWRPTLGTISYWGEQTEPMGCPWPRRSCSFFAGRFSGQVICAYRIVRGLILLFLGFQSTCAGPWEAEVCWESGPAAISLLFDIARAVHQLLSSLLWRSDSNTHLTQITSVSLTRRLLVPTRLQFCLRFQHADFLAGRYNPDVSTRRGRG